MTTITIPIHADEAATIARVLFCLDAAAVDDPWAALLELEGLLSRILAARRAAENDPHRDG